MMRTELIVSMMEKYRGTLDNQSDDQLSELLGKEWEDAVLAHMYPDETELHDIIDEIKTMSPKEMLLFVSAVFRCSGQLGDDVERDSREGDRDVRGDVGREHRAESGNVRAPATDERDDMGD